VFVRRDWGEGGARGKRLDVHFCKKDGELRKDPFSFVIL